MVWVPKTADFIVRLEDRSAVAGTVGELTDLFVSSNPPSSARIASCLKCEWVAEFYSAAPEMYLSKLIEHKLWHRNDPR